MPKQASTPSWWRWTDRASWLALGLCGCAAIALRFYAIDRLPGINGDEPQYAVHAHAFFEGAPLASLRTGSDLPMNPVFFGMVLLLQKLLPATLWSLRLSAVLLSCITVCLAWTLFRSRGRLFATTFACLVAVLPIHLGYARFAWDPTAIPTVSLLALGASMHLRIGWAVLAFALCLWVHPTSVFLLPTLLAPFVIVRWPRDAHGRWRWSRGGLLTAGVLLCLVPASAVGLVIVGLQRDMLPDAVAHVLRDNLLSNVGERVLQPRALGPFLLAYLELLSGPTIYRYITGSLSNHAARLHTWASAAVVLPLLAAGLRGCALRGRKLDLSIAAGLALSLLAEYVLAGPVALAPKTERYAVCLSVPACYVLSACVDALATSPARARLLRAAVSSIGVALLLSFCTFYLQRLKHADPEREDTFRTGTVEPKARALDAITQLRDPTRPALIVVEDWWIYWTLRYLAPPATGMRVTIHRHPWDYRFPRDFEPPAFDPERMQLFGVAWADHAADKSFAARSSEHVDILGYERGPILRVHKLRALPRPGRSKRSAHKDNAQ